MDEEFRKDRARTVREIAEKADPSTKKRLLELAQRYEREASNYRTPIPLPRDVEPVVDRRPDLR